MIRALTLTALVLSSFGLRGVRAFPKASVPTIAGLTWLKGGVTIRSFSNKASASTTDTDGLHKLPRIYIDQDLDQTEVTLSHDESHYLSNVMRAKPGFCFRGFNARAGQGEYLFEITESVGGRGGKAPSEVKASVKSMLRRFDDEINKKNNNALPVTLYFSPVKKPKLKQMMEKGTEIGLSRFVPVLSQNVNVNVDFEGDATFDRVILESVEQCERMDIPVLQRQPVSLSALLQEWEQKEESSSEVVLLLVCRERCTSAQPLLTALLGMTTTSMGDIGVVVGPEGGFTEEEFTMMGACKAVRFVSLGRNVLRAETAAIAALATVSAVCEHNNRTE